MKRFLLMILLLSVILAACRPAATSAPTAAALVKIRLPVGYIPNIQFAPLYVAMEKGYYNQAGINLKIDYSFEMKYASDRAVGASPSQMMDEMRTAYNLRFQAAH